MIAEVHAEVFFSLRCVVAVVDITEKSRLNVLPADMSPEMVLGVKTSVAEMTRDVLFGAVVNFGVLAERSF